MFKKWLAYGVRAFYLSDCGVGVPEDTALILICEGIRGEGFDFLISLFPSGGRKVCWIPP